MAMLMLWRPTRRQTTCLTTTWPSGVDPAGCLAHWLAGWLTALAPSGPQNMRDIDFRQVMRQLINHFLVVCAQKCIGWGIMLLPSEQKQQQQREQRQQPPPPPLTECWQNVAHPVDLQGQLQTAAPATATAAVPVPGQARCGWPYVPSTRHIVFSLHTLLDFVNLLTIWSYFCMLYCQFGGHWPFTWLAPVACVGCLLSPCRLSTSLVRCLLLASCPLPALRLLFWHTTHHVWQFGRLPGLYLHLEYSFPLPLLLTLTLSCVSVAVAVIFWLVAHICVTCDQLSVVLSTLQ